MLPLFLLADSRLPSGGHGHSGGVEARRTARWCGRPTISRSSWRGGCAPAAEWSRPLRRPHARWPMSGGTRSRRPGSADAAVSARTPSAAFRAASRAQGAALLRTVSLAFPTPAVAALRALPRVHHPLVLGVAAAAAGADPAQAAALALHHLVGGAATAAVRLLGLDPLRVTAVTAAVARPRRPRGRRRGRPRHRRCRRGRPGAAADRGQPPDRRPGRTASRIGGDPLCIVTTCSRINGAHAHVPLPAAPGRAVRIGIGGPVGAARPPSSPRCVAPCATRCRSRW